MQSWLWIQRTLAVSQESPCWRGSQRSYSQLACNRGGSRRTVREATRTGNSTGKLPPHHWQLPFAGLWQAQRPWAATHTGERFSAGTCQFCLNFRRSWLLSPASLTLVIAVCCFSSAWWLDLTLCLYKCSYSGQSFKARHTKEVISKQIMTELYLFQCLPPVLCQQLCWKQLACPLSGFLYPLLLPNSNLKSLKSILCCHNHN